MNEEVIRRFVSSSYAKVVAALTVVCGDQARAENAVQEALAKAWSHRAPIDNLNSWVSKVALNLVRSRLRRDDAERRANARWLAASVVAGPGPSLEHEEVRAALALLSRRQREVVVLHYFIDLSVAEIARALGVGEGTVKTCLHRARAALQSRLHPSASVAKDVMPCE